MRVRQLHAHCVFTVGDEAAAVQQLEQLVGRRAEMSACLAKDIALQLADVYTRLSRWSKAADALLIARSIADEEDNVVRQHAMLLDQLGNRDAYREALQRLLQLAPGQPAPERFACQSSSP